MHQGLRFAALWEDAQGGFLVAGCLRLALVYHSTFLINSVAHSIGTHPYDRTISALITLGEGYHNFHHRIQGDCRNGIRFWQFDPTKCWIWTAAKARLAGDLCRTPPELIARARAMA